MQKRYVQFCLFIILVICTAVGCSSGSSSPQAIVLDKTELVASLRKLLQEQKISPNIAMKRVASNNYDISLSPTNSKFILKRKNIVGNNANEIPCCIESSEIKNDVPCCSNEQPSKSVVKPVLSIKKQHRFKIRPKLRGSLRKDGSDEPFVCLCQLNVPLSEIENFFEVIDPETGDPETGDPETGDPETGDPETGDPNDNEYFKCTCCPNKMTCGCDWLFFYWYILYDASFLYNTDPQKAIQDIYIQDIYNQYDFYKSLLQDDVYEEDSSVYNVLSAILEKINNKFNPTEEGILEENLTLDNIQDTMIEFENIFKSIECPCRTETNISTSTADINRKPTDSGYNLDFTDLNDEPWTLKIPNKESYVNFLSPTEATISGYVLESNVKFTFHMIRESAADNYEWLIDDIRTEETNEYIIEGTIVDSSKSEVIPNATITISNKETYSDNLGRFTINLPQGEYDAVITAVGYATQTIRIQVPKENN